MEPNPGAEVVVRLHPATSVPTATATIRINRTPLLGTVPANPSSGGTHQGHIVLRRVVIGPWVAGSTCGDMAL